MPSNAAKELCSLCLCPKISSLVTTTICWLKLYLKSDWHLSALIYLCLFIPILQMLFVVMVILSDSFWLFVFLELDGIRLTLFWGWLLLRTFKKEMELFLRCQSGRISSIDWFNVSKRATIAFQILFFDCFVKYWVFLWMRHSKMVPQYPSSCRTIWRHASVRRQVFSFSPENYPYSFLYIYAKRREILTSDIIRRRVWPIRRNPDTSYSWVLDATWSLLRKDIYCPILNITFISIIIHLIYTW